MGKVEQNLLPNLLNTNQARKEFGKQNTKIQLLAETPCLTKDELAKIDQGRR